MILDNTPSYPLFCQAGRGEGVMGLAIHSGVTLSSQRRSAGLRPEPASPSRPCRAAPANARKR
jgi:hypothetical protein